MGNKLAELIVVGICLIILVSITGCLGPQESEKQSLSDVLNIFNWEDFFGETTIEDFEAEFGVKVNLDTYEDEEEIYSVIQSDPTKYDLVFPSGDTAEDLFNLNLITEINKENIPNLNNIYEKYLNLPHDPNNNYTIPYDWGTTGIIYNTKYIDEENVTNSWDMLFNSSYEGKIANLDNPYVVVGYTLKSLGYSINSINPDELNETKAKLLEQKPIVIGYLSAIEIQNKMISEELWIAPEYNGDAWVAIDSNPNLSYFVPNEGSDIYFDVIAIPIAAKHKYTAEVFLNYILRPEVHAAITNYTGYANPNQASHEAGLIDEEQINDPLIYPPQDIIDKLEPWILYEDEEEAGYQLQRINEIWATLQN